MKSKLKKSIIIFSLFGVGCGIKGPPLPPIEEETVQKQKAQEIKSTAVSADVTDSKKSDKPKK